MACHVAANTTERVPLHDKFGQTRGLPRVTLPPACTSRNIPRGTRHACVHVSNFRDVHSDCVGLKWVWRDLVRSNISSSSGTSFDAGVARSNWSDERSGASIADNALPNKEEKLVHHQFTRKRLADCATVTSVL